LDSVVKGNKEITDPDFLEAGDLILDALEFGSKFTWDLHVDLVGNDPVGPDGDTLYVFTFGGNRQYSGLVGLVSSLGRFDDSGTDGRSAGQACLSTAARLSWI
jgi:hypothetical protein